MRTCAGGGTSVLSSIRREIDPQIAGERLAHEEARLPRVDPEARRAPGAVGALDLHVDEHAVVIEDERDGDGPVFILLR